MSFLHRKFVKGSPNLFYKVIEVSCPIKFFNQDGESWQEWCTCWDFICLIRNVHDEAELAVQV